MRAKASTLTIILMLVVIFCGSCKLNENNQKSPTSTEMVFGTETPLFEELTATQTSTFQQSSRPTFVITATEDISTQTPTPTITPVSTLEEGEREDYIFQTINPSTNCPLPCWGGLQPGISNWESVVSVLQPLSINVDVVKDGSEIVFDEYAIKIAEPNKNIRVRIGYKFRVVQFMRVAIPIIDTPLLNLVTKEYSVTNILNNLRSPTRVLMNLQSTTAEPGAKPYFYLWLFFDNAGILIQYEGFQTTTSVGDNLIFCPAKQELQAITLYLQSPASSQSLEQLVELIYSPFNNETWVQNNFLFIEQALRITPQTMYETFQSDGDNSCFESFKNLWE